MTPGPSILVVEDNPVTRKMLRVALQSEGFGVVEAADGRAAIRAVEGHCPDLVLQDLILPDMDGFELVRRLRALPGGASIPILALSGFVGPAAEARAAQAEFTAVMVKPVDPSRLVAAIRACLPTRQEEPILRTNRRRVLLVDDDPVQLKLTRVHLGQLGFEVVVASSASEALRLARAHQPDLLLSDVLMPEVDGFQLCLEVRRDPALCGVPVVLVSSDYQTDADQALAARVGANGLLVRTPDLGALIPAVLEAAARPAPVPAPEENDRLHREHSDVVAHQLDRQLALSTSLSRRCTLQAAQLALLGGVADALARKADTDSALRDVLAATLDAAAISKGILYLQGTDGALSLRHGLGFSEVERDRLASFFGHMAYLVEVTAGKLAVAFPSPSAPPDVARALLEGAAVSSLEIVPLVSDGRGVGAIVLGAKRTDVTSEDSVAFARAIGNHIVKTLQLERSFASLAASERRQRAMMENAHDAIAILSSEGEIREVNRRWEEILGLPRRQMVGARLLGFSAPGREPENLDAYAKLVTADSPEGRPFELQRVDGSTAVIELSLTALDLAGEQLVFAIGRDITEQLQARAQLMVSDRMASIGTLAAGVAHEINNPLAAVIANLELLSRDLYRLGQQVGPSVPLGELEEGLAEARVAAMRVRDIVRDLRIFSRAEADQQGPVDVHGVLDSSLRMAWNEIRHRARLVKDYGDVPPVLGNESRLGQVFLNLVVNAAQALAEGRADSNEIRVRTRAAAGQARVVVEISDTGPGIPPEILCKLFTPFFTTKPAGVGTGLGLAICQRIVTSLGGEISVSSEVGRGATFRVVLPVADGAVAEPAAPAAPVAEVPARRRGRVLVVDDEVMVGTAIRRLLSAEHDTEVVDSAQTALERLSAGPDYDLIVCDLMMPVMTGMELHARLLEGAPELAARIVFLTGGAFTPRARAFLEENPNPHLEKPFDPKQLRALVNERVH